MARYWPLFLSAWQVIDLAMTASFSLDVNGSTHIVEADAKTPLLYILRNDLELNGPKFGCGLGECGACAVLIDGRAVRSCTIPLGAVGKRSVTTLEGLGSEEQLHPVQRAFIEEAAAQCGYCLNGMVIAVVALIGRNPEPHEDDIRDALRHHLCRCGTHVEILAAARKAVLLSRSANAGCNAGVKAANFQKAESGSKPSSSELSEAPQ
jgi:nicotinate dehydrogenase subunit A